MLDKKSANPQNSVSSKNAKTSDLTEPLFALHYCFADWSIMYAQTVWETYPTRGPWSAQSIHAQRTLQFSLLLQSVPPYIHTPPSLRQHPILGVLHVITASVASFLQDAEHNVNIPHRLPLLCRTQHPYHILQHNGTRQPGTNVRQTAMHGRTTAACWVVSVCMYQAFPIMVA